MTQTTKIAWADATWNPWIGCAKVSAGCQHCYAERFAARLGVRWGIDAERRRTKSWAWLPALNSAAIRGDRVSVRGPGSRLLVFTGSLCDFFDPRAELRPWREEAISLMQRCDGLAFLILTKRPVYVEVGQWNRQAWLGVSVESQNHVDRIDWAHHVGSGFAARFISYEPALGPLDLPACVEGRRWWVIYGGESGPGFRPDDASWARRVHAQCRERGVPFFMKQRAGPRAGLDPYLDGAMIREWPEAP